MPFIVLIVLRVISSGWVGIGTLYAIGHVCLPFFSPNGRSLKNVVTEYPLSASSNNPKDGPLTAIAPGPDGVLWFLGSASNQIGSVTAQGKITEYPLYSTDNTPLLTGLAAGPDGALWLTEPNTTEVGRVTTQGQITEYALLDANSYPGVIATRPDRNLWFLDGKNRASKIERLNLCSPDLQI